MLNTFGERRNSAVNEPHLKAVIAAPDIFEKAEHQTRVQVSEQAYYLTFPCGGFCTLASHEVTSRKLKTSRWVTCCVR